MFLTNEFHGTLKESEEGILRWYPIDQPPFDEMWEDDRYWYQHAIGGRSFRREFYFRGDFEKLVHHKIELPLARLTIKDPECKELLRRHLNCG